jgi:hypothetical protein
MSRYYFSGKGELTMSLLINGMDMPKDCAECGLSIYYDGYNGGYGYKPHGWQCRRLKRLIKEGESKPADCPLSEISIPHGRLIDADKLKVAVIEAMCRGIGVSITQLIDKAPTVIEKENTQ